MDYNNISIRQIEYFLAVANHLNYTKASKELYIAQSTLSKQIASFEKNINVQLFVRDKRTVKLTAAGTILRDKLKGIIEDIDRTFSHIRYIDKNFNSMIKIGCLTGLDTNSFWIEATDYFKSIYPNAMICYEKHSFKDLRKNLLEDKLDLIFTIAFDIELFENFQFREICAINSAVILSKKNPLANKEKLTLHDFKEESFLMITKEYSPGIFNSVLKTCNEYGFVPKVDIYLPNIDSVIMCVEANLGVAIVDANLVVSPDIIKVPIENTYVSVLAAWNKNNENNALKLYIDTLL